MAELADALRSGRSESTLMRVQIPPPAHKKPARLIRLVFLYARSPASVLFLRISGHDREDRAERGRERKDEPGEPPCARQEADQQVEWSHKRPDDRVDFFAGFIAPFARVGRFGFPFQNIEVLLLQSAELDQEYADRGEQQRSDDRENGQRIKASAPAQSIQDSRD